jgi:hypothetical protein
MAYRKRGSGETAAVASAAAPVAAPAYEANAIPTTTALLKGDGFGGVTEAVAGTDYAAAGGVSGTYSFGGGASGDIASMTFTNGLLTATTTVP